MEELRTQSPKWPQDTCISSVCDLKSSKLVEKLRMVQSTRGALLVCTWGSFTPRARGGGHPSSPLRGSFTPRCSEHWVALLLPSWAHSHLGTLINPSPCFTVVTLLAGLGDSATDPGHSNFTCIVSCFCHGNGSFHLNKISSSLHFVFLFYLLPRHLSL